jgi:hypothetical protein
MQFYIKHKIPFQINYTVLVKLGPFSMKLKLSVYIEGEIISSLTPYNYDVIKTTSSDDIIKLLEK